MELEGPVWCGAVNIHTRRSKIENIRIDTEHTIQLPSPLRRSLRVSRVASHLLAVVNTCELCSTSCRRPPRLFLFHCMFVPCSMTMRAAMRQPSPHALPSSRVAQLAIGAQFARCERCCCACSWASRRARMLMEMVEGRRLLLLGKAREDGALRPEQPHVGLA